MHDLRTDPGKCGWKAPEAVHGAQRAARGQRCGDPRTLGPMVVSLRRVASIVMVRVMVRALAGRLEASALASAALVLATATGCRLETAEAPVPAQALAPELSLLAHDGRTVTLDQLLARGPAVLVFYRGHW